MLKAKEIYNDLYYKLVDGTVVPALQAYHRHRIKGVANIPKEGRTMLVINHSFATYDLFLMNHEIYKRRGRQPWVLIDKFFFKFPLFKTTLANPYQMRQASPQTAKQLLENEEIILVSPGGMREWRRSSREKYKIDWRGRYGFAKLAIETNTPIVLAACPKADDIYKVYDEPVTNFLTAKLKTPFAFFRGVGPTPLPRPVKLTHYLSPPIMPPKDKTIDPVESLWNDAKMKMEQFLEEQKAA